MIMDIMADVNSFPWLSMKSRCSSTRHLLALVGFYVKNIWTMKTWKLKDTKFNFFRTDIIYKIKYKFFVEMACLPAMYGI
jgi:hypothetical protein